MKHVLRRAAVVCLAVPAIAFLGASAAQACQSPTTGSSSSSATPDPFPTLSANGTGATCSVDGDSHTDSPGHSHTHSHGMSNMPGMDGMDGMDDMKGMDGMDMPGMSGSHTHGQTTTTDTDHPRTAVLGAFGVVNGGVMASAAVVRRRTRAARKGAGR
ncbi:hypothetical protein [Streptomyces sp. NPDC047000]|uniref:hypothetical protein n=1 Tax=Streptomyces sp. NPDC047000 TaxID=3155474 RepID=UPI0033C9FDB8